MVCDWVARWWFKNFVNCKISNSETCDNCKLLGSCCEKIEAFKKVVEEMGQAFTKSNWRNFDFMYNEEKDCVFVRWICFKCKELCIMEIMLDKNVLFSPPKILPVCPTNFE